MEELIDIKVSELKKLLESQFKLLQLEGAGVDNWSGYDYLYDDDFYEVDYDTDEQAFIERELDQLREG